MRSRVVSKQLGVEAVRCVELWRVFLVMMELGSSFGYRRSLDVFRWREAEFVLEYDSSLTGLGVIFFIKSILRFGASAWRQRVFP